MPTVCYITNQIMNSRTYILSCEGKDVVWLVDCGDFDRVLEMIGGRTVEGVLLTHAHSDHIYGLEALIKRFPKVKIFTNEAGVASLHSPKLNISHYHDEYPDIFIDKPENIQVVNEGCELDVLGEKVAVYETPGHAPSSITYIIGDNVFTGDAFIPGVKVFTGFPHSNRKQAQESIERILRLSKNLIVMPGHTVQNTEGEAI